MTRRRDTDGAGGQRAGLSVARAQRLSAKTAAPEGQGGRVLAGLGFLAIAGLVGLGILFVNAPEAVTEVAAAEAAPTAPEAIAAALPKPEPAAVEMPVAVAAAEPIAAAEAIPEPLPVAAAPCVQTIEALLASLGTAASKDERWSAHEGDLNQLVQATLDCEDAGFRVAGSLELVGSGLADLKVRWDRKEKILDLAMVDRPADASARPPVRLDEAGVEFVIR
jgi:hypothetical protein